MSWYSIYGTGASIYGIESAEEQRVRFTSWLSILWVPVIPLATWSAVYVGDRPPDGLTDESHCFADLCRLPHDWLRLSKTFLSGLLATAIALAPTAYMLARVNGRAATNVEMVFVFAACFWIVAVILWAKRLRRQRLRDTMIISGSQVFADTSAPSPEIDMEHCKHNHLRRSRQRAISLAALAAFGLVLIVMGFRGWAVDGLPAHYLGYFCLALVLLGLIGVNVWRGGPLDPRNDAPKREPLDSA